MMKCGKNKILVFFLGILSPIFILPINHNWESQFKNPIVVIITSYNNSQWWLPLNLITTVGQDYGNFRIIYIDDDSLDETGDRVENFFSEALDFVDNLNFEQYFISADRNILKKRISRLLDQGKEKFFRRIFFDEMDEDIPQATARFRETLREKNCFFTLVSNKKRAGALANLYRAIHSTRDHVIIVTIDGDDWLTDERVLSRINKAYNSSDIWMTHGSFIEYPNGEHYWSKPIPPEIIKENAFRNYRCPSHLRTFYSWIFKKIDLEDLLYEGKFFPTTWDFAIEFPIAEMAGERQAFLSLNYVYNMSNPINDGKVNEVLLNHLDRFIRDKKSYKKIERVLKVRVN